MKLRRIVIGFIFGLIISSIGIYTIFGKEAPITAPKEYLYLSPVTARIEPGTLPQLTPLAYRTMTEIMRAELKIKSNLK